MSVLSEPDWDAGTENAYERHLASQSDGLCIRPWCDDEALPDNELCRDCLAEMEEVDDED
jgi:hypothetical protein